MRLYLIGLPGSGKSYLGKKLAEDLNYKFIDMDQYIEQQAMMFVDEIFKAYGEEFFRALETNALKDFLDIDNVVIATGGGVVKNIANKKLMDGKCIYLYAPFDILQNRCDESLIIRPLLKDKSVYMLYLERKDFYENFKDFEIQNTDVNEAILEIKETLRNLL